MSERLTRFAIFVGVTRLLCFAVLMLVAILGSTLGAKFLLFSRDGTLPQKAVTIVLVLGGAWCLCVLGKFFVFELRRLRNGGSLAHPR
jgi:hypothetical protein